METFWTLWWDWSDLIADTRGDRVLVDGDNMPKARFFPDARLNFTENLLRRRGGEPALIFRNEKGDRREISWDGLHRQVARLATAMKAHGITPGDRVAAYMPNLPETIMIALAAAAIGATFSSCSTDYGVTGVLDRFGQVAPVLLFTTDGHNYNGKAHSTVDRLTEIQAGLPSLRQTVLTPYLDPDISADSLADTVLMEDFVAGHDAAHIPYERLPFNHPLFVLFSSGTTGVPKCIVHSAGGTLVQQLKEDRLHHDVRPDDRILFFTSTSWVVWNMHLSFLGSGATLLIYEGSPLYPDPTTAFAYIEAEQATYFGTSAKFIDTLRLGDQAIGERFDLASLRTIVTSGSPLVEESFEYVHRRIKPDIHLGSVSGGTDIMCGFTVCEATAPGNGGGRVG
jgi:acetoacetyl-CoA synthetase